MEGAGGDLELRGGLDRHGDVFTRQADDAGAFLVGLVVERRQALQHVVHAAWFVIRHGRARPLVEQHVLELEAERAGTLVAAFEQRHEVGAVDVVKRGLFHGSPVRIRFSHSN